MLYLAVMSVWTQKARFKPGRTQTELSANKECIEAVECMVPCMPSPESPDYKPDDPEYQALRAQASSTLEAFLQFLSTSLAIELVNEVNDVFYALHEHGEKAGLLSPPLIRAMSDYLDAYKKACGALPDYLKWNEEWIGTLYHNLKPDDSGQVRSLPFLSYESALTLNFTLIHHPNAAAVASASANAVESDNPPVNSSSVAEYTTTKRASGAIIPLVQGASSARPEESGAEVSPLTSLPAPSTNPIQDSASVELTPCAPMSEDAPAPQRDAGPARADQDKVSETPASVGSGGTSNANPQETQSPLTEVSLTPQPADESVSHDVDKSGES